ncbi:hypothetical protein JD969_08350 [Planctomycetota bacterium]|nr:hypothetical protein JD969_08350 [Planctomycetota bacterium]
MAHITNKLGRPGPYMPQGVKVVSQTATAKLKENCETIGVSKLQLSAKLKRQSKG